MSFLSGPQIKEEVRHGNIHINPFDERRLNPNSYNLRLDPQLLVYEKNYHLHKFYEDWYAEKKMPMYEGPPDVLDLQEPLDMKVDEPVRTLLIDMDKGQRLWPGVLYLACTVEEAGSDRFVPCIEGRSSIGRLSVSVHTTAGFGDLGFSAWDFPAQWTLEITVTIPIIIYAGIEICQVAFTTPHHEPHLGPLPKYRGKYTGQRGPKKSAIWKDFVKEK